MDISFEKVLVAGLVLINAIMPVLIYLAVKRGYEQDKHEMAEGAGKQFDTIFKWMKEREKLWDAERERLLGKWFVKNQQEYNSLLQANQKYFEFINRPIQDKTEFDQQLEIERQVAAQKFGISEQELAELMEAEQDVIQGDA